jgi:hypothetical protein
MNSWKPYGNIKGNFFKSKKLNVTDNVKERGAPSSSENLDSNNDVSPRLYS